MSMASDVPSWHEYLVAARRKVEIAAYHADCLDRELNAASGPVGLAPSIPVQAHFEGVVVSVMAAVDQIAQAVNKTFGLRLPPHQLVEKAFTAAREKVPSLSGWYEDPLGVDLRRIRV